MSLAEPAQREGTRVVPLRCRFEMTAAEAALSDEFCVFDFPGCDGCPKSQRGFKTAGSPEDPMKSKAWQEWARTFRARK
jgi:hypothetical protein